jgi:hypothetical protein
MIKSQSVARRFEVDTESTRSRHSRLSRCVIGWTVALMFCSSLHAEEQTSPGSLETQEMFDQYKVSPGRASFILSLSSQPRPVSQQPFHLIQTCRLTSLFKKVEGEQDLEDDSSITLFRKTMPSRYAYHSWAGFRTGWGQYFSADTFGRSRTNGAGIDDPDFLYVKMSVRF